MYQLSFLLYLYFCMFLKLLPLMANKDVYINIFTSLVKFCDNFNVIYQVVVHRVSTAVCTASRILSQLYHIVYDSLLKDECKHCQRPVTACCQTTNDHQSHSHQSCSLIFIAGQECDCVSLCDHVTVFYIIIV